MYQGREIDLFLQKLSDLVALDSYSYIKYLRFRNQI